MPESLLAFLQEIHDFGPTLSPPVEPDLISPTTYFGNGIQDWAHERARFGKRAAATPSRFLFEAQGEALPDGWVGAEAMVRKDDEEPVGEGAGKAKKAAARGRKKTTGRKRAATRRAPTRRRGGGA